jgi:hypothetical protein
LFDFDGGKLVSVSGFGGLVDEFKEDAGEAVASKIFAIYSVAESGYENNFM